MSMTVGNAGYFNSIGVSVEASPDEVHLRTKDFPGLRNGVALTNLLTGTLKGGGCALLRIVEGEDDL